jgi:hypothetical protein
MSNKKPISSKVVNQQEIESVHIDTNEKILTVSIKTYLEEADTPTVDHTRISNVSRVTKTLQFTDVANINGILTSINNQI